MVRLAQVLLLSLPALTLTIGFVVSRADPETWFVGVPSLIWAAIWAVACWMLAVVNSLIFIKGASWVLRPMGIVVSVCTVATGLAAFYFGSVALSLPQRCWRQPFSCRHIQSQPQSSH